MLIALLQAIVSGLAVGSAYALIALGFSITFTTTKTLNFSHGDFVSVGAFIGVTILWLLLGKPINSPLTGVSIATWQQLVAALGSVLVIGLSRRPPLFPGRASVRRQARHVVGDEHHRLRNHAHEPRLGDLGTVAGRRAVSCGRRRDPTWRHRHQATGDPDVRGGRDHHGGHRPG